MAFTADSIFWVEVEKIVPNPYQPRREFDEAKLKELAESVRMYGILQPLTVTKKEIVGEDGSFRSEYELIAGERRLRASKLAGLSLVPVIIRDGEQTEQEKLELAIIENLQREDLNAVDRALAFRQLADVFGLSHVQVAQKVGRSREYVSNSIRLLALPDYMLDALRKNDLTEGHARTLLMLNDRPEEQDVIFREILLKKLSVREVERIARGIAVEKVRKKELVDNDLLSLEQQFTSALGTRVSITKTDFGGRVMIDYFSLDDLEEILQRMKREAARAAVSPEYRDESKDTVVSDVVDEEAATLAALAAATGLEPIIRTTADVTELPKEEVVDTPVVAEALPVASTPVIDTAPQVVMAVPSVEEPIITVPVETPVVVAAEPVVAPMAVAAPVAKLTLREQLAALLGDQKPPVEPVPETPAATTVAPVANESLSYEPPALKKDTTDDESDLYSINRFTV